MSIIEKFSSLEKWQKISIIVLIDLVLVMVVASSFFYFYVSTRIVTETYDKKITEEQVQEEKEAPVDKQEEKITTNYEEKQDKKTAMQTVQDFKVVQELIEDIKSQKDVAKYIIFKEVTKEGMVEPYQEVSVIEKGELIDIVRYKFQVYPSGYISVYDDETNSYLDMLYGDLEETRPRRYPARYTITEIDDTWNLYTNSRHGFSIQVPKQMFHYYGNCIWKDDIQSYINDFAHLPVKIFDDLGTVYITSRNYYELTEPQKVDAMTYFKGCENLQNSLYMLEDPDNYFQRFWKFEALRAEDTKIIDAFIKAKYGLGCKYGGKIPSNKPDTFDIKIEADEKYMEQRECFLNYITVVKYYEPTKTLVSWDIGQSSTFFDEDYLDTSKPPNDFEMKRSFQFIDFD